MADELTVVDEELSLDDSRDFLYTALRACERFTDGLRKAVDDLNKLQADGEWLEKVQSEAEKADNFYTYQQVACSSFAKRVNDFVDLVRKEADELAMEELGEHQAAGKEGVSTRKKSSKSVHPELQKFKQEKIAKILGKFGGMPALGGGMVLPRPGRATSIMRATASPAAREIHYSKMENTEAAHLAEVMQFKARKAEASPSQWQEEARDALTRVAVKNTAQTPAICTTAAAPFANELTGRLADRQAALVARETEAVDIARRAAASSSSGGAPSELSEMFARRQSAAQVNQPSEPSTPVPAPTPSGPSIGATPYTNELAQAIARRQSAGQVSGGGAGLPPPSPTPVTGATPGLFTPGNRPRAGTVSTVPSPAVQNELEERLRRRASSLSASEMPAGGSSQ